MLVAGLTGCSNLPKATNPVVEEVHVRMETATGTITYIDEDSVLISYESGNKGLGGNFQYEIIDIETAPGIKTLIAPFPTQHKVGEQVSITYAPRSVITLTELVKKYSNKVYYARQQNLLHIDGIIQREM